MLAERPVVVEALEGLVLRHPETAEQAALAACTLRHGVENDQKIRGYSERQN